MLDALTMSNGRSIPAQGFGVFQIPAEQTADAVAQAIEVGYRHIDTAQSYFNEETVGEGILAAGSTAANCSSPRRSGWTTTVRMPPMPV